MERAALLRSTPLACTRFFLHLHRRRPSSPFRHLRRPLPPSRSCCSWRIISSSSSSPSSSDGFPRGFSAVPARAVAAPTQPSPGSPILFCLSFVW
ncbi:hypothetical protein MLD38_023051 [Melastoma candidum]|uniref:Uncharacterized protein n=1 Tax=Melastoma candidum TaxID=119954 RepID=A0ACB9QPB9_9MYRT|nr:hypothetical protein MLD38_023051 [Melastoma candidum]